MSKKRRYDQAVLTFMVVLFLFMAVADFFVVRHQRNFLMQNAESRLKRDLELVGDFIVDPLLEYDYSWVDQFVKRWAGDHGEILELRVTLPNGMDLVRFERPPESSASFRVTQEVRFAGKPVATLMMVTSQRQVEQLLSRMRLQLYLLSFLLMVFAGFALWFTLKRLAIAPLEEEIELRRRAEEELEEARDRLEERVRERTRDLEEANRLLRREIRERQAAEASLRALHRQNEMILNAAGEGIYGIDVQGTITFVNRAAQQMLGYSEEELVGFHLHERNHHLRWDGTPYEVDSCPICASYRHPREYRGTESYFARRDGSIFPVEYVSAPLMEDGTVIGTVVVFVDISERKRTERELLALTDSLEQRVKERTARLDAANAELRETLGQLEEMQVQLVESEKMAALGDLVAGIAHEINTPVGIGVTAASHLEKETSAFEEIYRTGNLRKKELERYLSHCRESTALILKNLNRAAELIRSFKQVATDQSGEARRKFKVREYIEEVLLSLRPILKKTRLETVIDCDPELAIVSYPGAFSQIITNFVTNSVIHGFEEGAQGRLAFTVKRREDRLIFVYADNGRGMAKEHLAHIFEPFYTTNREKGGSGLGLHVVYNLVTQKLNGTIKCTSAPGQGVTFEITVPLPKEERKSA